MVTINKRVAAKAAARGMFTSPSLKRTYSKYEKGRMATIAITRSTVGEMIKLMKGQALAADCTTLSVCLVCSSAIVISGSLRLRAFLQAPFFVKLGALIG